jgi:hypothetical protein
MLEPNALKVTMLFPIFANDESPFSIETWSWWLDSIVAIGAYHEFFTRGSWEGRPEYHRCVTMILESADQLRRVEEFLREAREMFGQDVMYFEATQVHFRLI